MLTLKTVKQLAAILVIMLAVDAVYLRTIYGAFEKMVVGIQGSSIKFRTLGAVVCYAALTLGLYYFIVKDRRPATDAAILGGVVYAVYESTSYATLKGWDEKIFAMDSVWGAALFYIVTKIVYFLGL